jgi:hypothetical protein
VSVLVECMIRSQDSVDLNLNNFDVLIFSCIFGGLVQISLLSGRSRCEKDKQA